MKKRDFIYLAVIALLGAVLFFAMRGRHGGIVRTVTRVDTLIVLDTIRDTVLVPRTRYIVRTDTVRLHTASDKLQADSVQVAVPVERKVYETDDYRAVVEGFRPALVEMEVYRQTVRIDRETIETHTQKPRRWGIGVQAGYGLTTKGAVPYIGIGLQYSIVSW